MGWLMNVGLAHLFGRANRSAIAERNEPTFVQMALLSQPERFTALAERHTRDGKVNLKAIMHDPEFNMILQDARGTKITS